MDKNVTGWLVESWRRRCVIGWWWCIIDRRPRRVICRLLIIWLRWIIGLVGRIVALLAVGVPIGGLACIAAAKVAQRAT